MHSFKKVAMFVASSFLIVLVGLAVLNRISARSSVIRKVLGA